MSSSLHDKLLSHWSTVGPWWHDMGNALERLVYKKCVVRNEDLKQRNLGSVSCGPRGRPGNLNCDRDVGREKRRRQRWSQPCHRREARRTVTYCCERSWREAMTARLVPRVTREGCVFDVKTFFFFSWKGA